MAVLRCSLPSVASEAFTSLNMRYVIYSEALVVRARVLTTLLDPANHPVPNVRSVPSTGVREAQEQVEDKDTFQEELGCKGQAASGAPDEGDGKAGEIDSGGRH